MHRFHKLPLLVSFFRSNNNFFTTISIGKSLPFFSASAGVIGLSGSRRDTPTSAQLAGKAVARKIGLKGYNRVYLKVVSNFDPTVKGFLRGLKSSSVRVLKLLHLKPITHNGVRLRKPRRM